jgi:hypothetical protein
MLYSLCKFFFFPLNTNFRGFRWYHPRILAKWKGNIRSEVMSKYHNHEFKCQRTSHDNKWNQEFVLHFLLGQHLLIFRETKFINICLQPFQYTVNVKKCLTTCTNNITNNRKILYQLALYRVSTMFVFFQNRT